MVLCMESSKRKDGDHRHCLHESKETHSISIKINVVVPAHGSGTFNANCLEGYVLQPNGDNFLSFFWPRHTWLPGS